MSMKNILSGCLHKNIDSIGGAWIGIIVWGFLCVCTNSYGQALRGTTGLLHAPTADMQQDKTFMFWWETFLQILLRLRYI